MSNQDWPFLPIRYTLDPSLSVETITRRAILVLQGIREFAEATKYLPAWPHDPSEYIAAARDMLTKEMCIHVGFGSLLLPALANSQCSLAQVKFTQDIIDNEGLNSPGIFSLLGRINCIQMYLIGKSGYFEKENLQELHRVLYKVEMKLVGTTSGDRKTARGHGVSDN